jgi:hypothetical protein
MRYVAIFQGNSPDSNKIFLLQKKCGAIPPLPQYIFMAWCLVKHRDNFTLPLSYKRKLSVLWQRLRKESHRQNLKKKKNSIHYFLSGSNWFV